jgi:hypothetical protein
MSLTTSVIRKISDLEEEEWIFHFFEDRSAIVLDRYIHRTRENTRKRTWKTIASYYRLSSRDHSIKEEPDVPPACIERALEKLRSRITFKKWNN